MPRLVLDTLQIRHFRNLADVRIAPSGRLNIVSGQNGHGKTSLLEALYFVATSRSFRTHKLGEIAQHGAGGHAAVAARFTEDPEDAELAPLGREQTATIEGGRAVVRADHKKPPSLFAYATRSPVVVFHPGEMSLSQGPAGGRRTLLDRVALYMGATSADHKARYERAIKARHDLLRRGGSEGEIEAFEALAARYGALLTEARGRAAAALVGELSSAWRRIGAPELTLAARYVPGGSADEQEAREALSEHRRSDGIRSSAAFGPHKDDMEILLDGHKSRVVGSQGQHRAITLSLKAAEVATITAERGVHPILLLDDVSSELDAERTHALFAYLVRQRGQIFVTTTRPDLIEAPRDLAVSAKHFAVESGQAREAPGR